MNEIDEYIQEYNNLVNEIKFLLKLDDACTLKFEYKLRNYVKVGIPSVVSTLSFCKYCAQNRIPMPWEPEHARRYYEHKLGQMTETQFNKLYLGEWKDSNE